MTASNGPNWLSVIGMIYMLYAFGLLALSAAYRSVRADAQAQMAAESQRRVAWTFAGVTGMLGVALQVAGQFIHLDEGVAMVLMLLSLVVMLLGFVVFTFRMAEASRKTLAEGRAEQLSSMPQQHAGPYGHAAE
jgi:predicted membrane channel-forming protein YqfA (hemolysin III family)